MFTYEFAVKTKKEIPIPRVISVDYIQNHFVGAMTEEEARAKLDAHLAGTEAHIVLIKVTPMGGEDA